MARNDIVIDISAQDRFSPAFARIGAGMASLTTRLDEARQATAPLAEGLGRVAESAEALGFVVEGIGRQLGSDLPADLEQTNIVLRLQNDELRNAIDAWADLELAAERAAASMEEAGDDLLFSPAAIGAVEDFGRRAVGQVTGLRGAVAGLQAGNPMLALVGGLADLVLSNSETQAFLAELNQGINDVLAPILRDVLGPTLEALRPALEQLSAAMIELEPVFKALGIAIAVALAPLIISMRALAAAIDFLADIDDALKSAVEFLRDAIDALNLTGGGGFGLGGDRGLLGGGIIPGFLHEGGVAGHHNLLRLPGMAADEGLAVLQTGERVLPRGAAGDAGPSTGPSTSSGQGSGLGGIVFNITASDPRAVREEVRQVIEELALTGRLALAR